MIPHHQAIKIAKKMTRNASEVKDWRLQKKVDRENRDEARKLAGGKGYIIATVSEIKEKHPDSISLFTAEDGHKYLWAIGKTIPDRNRRVGIRFVAVHQF